MPRFAISSWSVDGLLQAGTPLLDLPKLCAEHGIFALELCHFHLPQTDDGYLRELKQAAQQAGVTLSKLLIDTGDLTAPDPDERERDLRTIERWIGVASSLGIPEVRVDAGLQPPTAEVIAKSAEGLRRCAQMAAPLGVRVITENWHRTAQEADEVLQLLELCDAQVGLCADTGNAEETLDKYETLARLLPHASSVHFKARYDGAGEPDADDLRRCGDLLRRTPVDVITLIYAEKRDEWRGIAQLQAALEAQYAVA